MKIKTHWSGVMLISTNNNDDKVFEDLIKLLPEAADYPYETGEIEIKKDDSGHITIFFSR